MNKDNLIKFLRDSLLIQDPTITGNNPNYLELSDLEILLILQIAISKVDGSVSIANVPSNLVYPIILVAKKEIYHRLSVKHANSYDIEGDAGSLSKSDVFEHYFKLIEEVEKEYKNYMSTGVVPTQGEILLDTRYFSPRNYSLSQTPSVNLFIDKVSDTFVEISWDVPNLNKLKEYRVYISDKPIIDTYNDNKESTSPRYVIRDVHTRKRRLENLIPNTSYYVCVLCEERNSLVGFSETKIVTEPKVVVLC